MGRTPWKLLPTKRKKKTNIFLLDGVRQVVSMECRMYGEFICNVATFLVQQTKNGDNILMKCGGLIEAKYGVVGLKHHMHNEPITIMQGILDDKVGL